MIDQPSVQRISRREDVAATFSVMSQLRPHLAVDGYVETIARMMADGFRLAVVKVGSEVVAVAGYRFGENLALGRHCYVDDLVTTDTVRSHGYGRMLLDWLKVEARSEGCAALNLDSGVHRHGAHRFYLRERMDITSYHFKIALE